MVPNPPPNPHADEAADAIRVQMDQARPGWGFSEISPEQAKEGFIKVALGVGSGGAERSGGTFIEKSQPAES